MELECTQLETQLQDIKKQESQLLSCKICLCKQLGLLSKKKGEAIKCELTMIKDQETLKQKASHIVSPPTLDNLFSLETLASLESLSLSVLASICFFNCLGFFQHCTLLCCS